MALGVSDVSLLSCGLSLFTKMAFLRRSSWKADGIELKSVNYYWIQ